MSTSAHIAAQRSTAHSRAQRSAVLDGVRDHTHATRGDTCDDEAPLGSEQRAEDARELQQCCVVRCGVVWCGVVWLGVRWSTCTRQQAYAPITRSTSSVGNLCSPPPTKTAPHVREPPERFLVSTLSQRLEVDALLTVDGIWPHASPPDPPLPAARGRYQTSRPPPQPPPKLSTQPGRPCRNTSSMTQSVSSPRRPSRLRIPPSSPGSVKLGEGPG